jgi:hypothetical protein
VSTLAHGSGWAALNVGSAIALGYLLRSARALRELERSDASPS